MKRLAEILARRGARAVGWLAVLAPAAAWAQETVPQPDLKRAPPPWVGYLIMVVLVAAVMAVSLMPSKRGHQD